MWELRASGHRGSLFSMAANPLINLLVKRILMKGASGKMARAAATMVEMEGEGLPKSARKLGEMLSSRLALRGRLAEAPRGVKEVIEVVTGGFGSQKPLPNVSMGQLVSRIVDVTKGSARTLEVSSGGATAILHLKDVMPFRSHILRAVMTGRKLTRRQLIQLHLRDLKAGVLRKARIKQYLKVLENSTRRIPDDVNMTSGLWSGRAPQVMKHWKADALMHFTDSLEEVEELASRAWMSKVTTVSKKLETTTKNLPGWMKSVLRDKKNFYAKLFGLSDKKRDRLEMVVKAFGKQAKLGAGPAPSMGRGWQEIYEDLRRKAGIDPPRYPR